MIYEPVQGEGGFHPATEGFVEGLVEICARYGIVYISDEVQSGMCRTGYPAAVERWGVEPDLITWGKSMGGGMPIAGVTGRADIMDSVHPGGLGGTYVGNPVSCAAAIVALDQVLDPAFQEQSRVFGDRLRARLEDIATRMPAIGEVRGLGAMLAIELVEDRDPARRRPRPSPSRTIEIARANGLLLMGAGVLSNVIRVLVPLVATDADLDEGLEIFESALREASAA